MTRTCLSTCELIVSCGEITVSSGESSVSPCEITVSCGEITVSSGAFAVLSGEITVLSDEIISCDEFTVSSDDIVWCGEITVSSGVCTTKRLRRSCYAPPLCLSDSKNCGFCILFCIMDEGQCIRSLTTCLQVLNLMHRACLCAAKCIFPVFCSAYF